MGGELEPLAAERAERDQPTTRRHAAERLYARRAADRVQRDVDPATTGRTARLGRPATGVDADRTHDNPLLQKCRPNPLRARSGGGYQVFGDHSWLAILTIARPATARTMSSALSRPIGCPFRSDTRTASVPAWRRTIAARVSGQWARTITAVVSMQPATRRAPPA